MLASCGGGSSGGSASTPNTPDTAIPTAPSNLIATASSGAVYLSWSASDGATSYQIHQVENSFAGVAITDYGTLASYTSAHVMTNSIEIIGLMNNTTYHFVVTALFANGQESTASNEVIGLPDFPIPLAPTNLTVSASSGTVNLKWGASSGAISYKIHQSIETFGSISQLNYGVLLSYQSTEVNTTSSKITGRRTLGPIIL